MSPSVFGEGFISLIEGLIQVVEGLGVAVIAVGIVVNLWLYVWTIIKSRSAESAFETYRIKMGKAILLGLEILVAGDIISTVTVHLTLRSLAELGLLILIRTFISFALEVEISRRWPWQREKGEAD